MDVPYPELRRALFFKVSIFVLATLSTAIVPQGRWTFSAFERFVIAAFGVFRPRRHVCWLRLE